MSDSHFEATLTVDFDAVVTSDTPMYDAETGQMTSQMTLDSPPARFSIQAGYDAQGVFTFDQTALDPAGNPLTQSVDNVRRVQVRNDAVTLVDANGAAVAGTELGNGPSLLAILGAQNTEALVFMDGLVVTSFPQVGSTAQRTGPNSTTTTATVTTVTTAGDLTTVATTVQSTDPTVPALPQRRIYTRRGSEHVLSEIQTDVATQVTGTSVAGMATVRFEQVTYSRNVQKDQARRTGTSANAWYNPAVAPSEIPPPPCDEDNPETCSGGGTTGGGTQSGCTTTAGGANLVFVHGINSNGPAWGSVAAGTAPSGGVIGPVRCALRVATERTPSLTAGGTRQHAEQAAELRPLVLGTTQNVFVAHSQGGLISRRVAQGLAATNVRAVVTTGTPHAGAPIANTLNPGGGLGGIIRVFSGGAACRFVSCSPVSAGLIVLRDAYLAATYSSPAMADLRPGSPALSGANGVNTVAETFPRFGITNSIPRRWAFARVGGDLLSGNSGAQMETWVTRVYWGAVIGAVVSSFIPFFHPAAAPLAFVALSLDQTSRWWTRITVGGDQGDGVVPLASQRYPSATFNYPAPDPVSHTGEIDTRRSATAIEFVLRQNVQIPPRI